MTHSITLELPESVYTMLVEKAATKGKRVEDFAVEQLSNGDSGVIDDPFEKFIGSIHSDIHDWGSRHDELLGAVYLKELRSENE